MALLSIGMRFKAASALEQPLQYPLSAFRAMNAAALKVYTTIRKEGSQKNLFDSMQTRAELYEFLDYKP